MKYSHNFSINNFLIIQEHSVFRIIITLYNKSRFIQFLHYYYTNSRDIIHTKERESNCE
jgi:hypothetical protein